MCLERAGQLFPFWPLNCIENAEFAYVSLAGKSFVFECECKVGYRQTEDGLCVAVVA